MHGTRTRANTRCSARGRARFQSHTPSYHEGAEFGGGALGCCGLVRWQGAPSPLDLRPVILRKSLHDTHMTGSWKSACEGTRARGRGLGWGEGGQRCGDGGSRGDTEPALTRGHEDTRTRGPERTGRQALERLAVLAQLVLVAHGHAVLELLLARAAHQLLQARAEVLLQALRAVLLLRHESTREDTR